MCDMIAPGTTCHNITGASGPVAVERPFGRPSVLLMKIRETDEYGAECPRNQELLRIRPPPANPEITAGVLLPPAVNADGCMLGPLGSEMECASEASAFDHVCAAFSRVLLECKRRGNLFAKRRATTSLSIFILSRP